ncbi:MAG: acylneuraminate cytidylyltransferase family protein [Phycisphaerae bacterium]|nr:acylneuraminate cytidylyltransferase family protein [Phycisphaerae bacterium]
MRIAAFIPAREGSKRVPNKNLINLGDRPLLAYTCQAALESGVFDDVFVNTDSPAIALVARRHGVACPRLRPESLATDEATTRDAMIWYLRWLSERGTSYDALMILQPTSPLRTADDIRATMNIFEEHAPCAVISVTPCAPGNWLGRVRPDGQFEPLVGDDYVYRLNGAIYAYTWDDYLNMRVPRKTLAYVMPPRRSVDIDTFDDLRLAQAYLTDDSRVEATA